MRFCRLARSAMKSAALPVKLAKGSYPEAIRLLPDFASGIAEPFEPVKDQWCRKERAVDHGQGESPLVVKKPSRGSKYASQLFPLDSDSLGREADRGPAAA